MTLCQFGTPSSITAKSATDVPITAHPAALVCLAVDSIKSYCAGVPAGDWLEAWACA